MSTQSPAPPDAADPKQAAYDALNDLLAQSTAAANNKDNTKQARDAAFSLRTATAAQLDALDQAKFTGNTVDLQAAEEAMSPGMKQLQELQTQIEALGNELKEATSILTGIDKVIAELGGLGLV